MISQDQKVVVPSTPGNPANVGVPTQVANPRRAGWRTFIQSALPILFALNLAIPLLQDLLATPPFDALTPGWAIVALNLFGLVIAFLAKLLAQLMAIPAVNDWISRNVRFLAPIKQIASRPESPTHQTQAPSAPVTRDDD
ncbi:hypothetical protein E3T55_11155 [Cryobacterium frigoriphilum]|uniref:Uncharacterized protein n=1 Tax=Cryobacterium frigoriphilum TaxID=1259150 RepID=A0A4R9A038_9MICO|nr:hypothetical protein [Cryobacterium frigoriphilum]TFD49627.1 hypothetical protein E3T55_11155 [Cryobacterium frigoriphilum]